jgi:hypothetical protein
MASSPLLVSRQAPSSGITEDTLAGPCVRWRIADDGVLMIEAPGLVLSGAFPAWNDAPLRPVAVTVTHTPTHTEARYRCVDGTLLLVATATAEGLSLRATLLGFARAPRRLLVLGPARLSGAVAWMQNG